MQKNASIPAITGEIDANRAIHIFPEAISPYRSTIMAYSTSFVATSIGFPFDTVKTRIQSYKKFTSVWDCVVQSYRMDGIRGFYRGIWAPMFSTAFTRSLSVTLLTTAKPYCYEALFGWNKTSKSAELHPLVMNVPVCFLAGAFAGAGTSVISTPFEFVKVYSQISNLAYTQSHPGTTEAPRQSTASIVKSVCKHNGPGALYAGYRFQILRDAGGSGVYFAVYESVKWASNMLLCGDPAKSSPFSIMGAGGMAGALCWASVFPIDTIKSLVQKDVVTNTLRLENGLDALPPKERKLSYSRQMYRGVAVSMSRSFLVSMVFFSTYEFAMKTFV